MRIQKGFSLIEVLIATGLMAMIGLAMANYFQNNIKAQQTVGKGYEKDSLHEEIRRFLSNEKDCSATFSGINPATPLDVQKLIIAPNVDSKYVKSAVLGGGHIKITAMAWGGYAANASAPGSGIAILSVNYQKVGESIGPADYKPKEIEINVVSDTLTGKLVSCQSRSAMSDGLWTRSTVTDLVPTQKNIYYNAGTVGVGTDTPHSGTLAHFHNPGNQGAVYISGASDAGPSKATWSALYLGDGNAANYSAASNQWVMAYKNQAAPSETKESFVIAYQKKNANTWNQNSGYAGLILTPPDLSAAPPKQGTLGVGTTVPNETAIAHFHNSNWQGSVSISGKGDGNETWSSLVLGNEASSTKAAASRQWAMAYKKIGQGNETPESLLFTYQNRGAGGWALAGGSTPLTITPPGSNGVGAGGIGIFIEKPTAELHVDGKSIITGLAKFENDVKITNDLTVRDITASGTITSTGAISSGSTITAASDQRLKKDIQSITFDLLPLIEKLRPVSYLRKDERLNDQGREIGFIAQDVQRLFPELVREIGSTHMLAINYGQLTAVLTKGVQELQQQNLKCFDENKNLKKQLAAMEARLQKIEQALSHR